MEGRGWGKHRALAWCGHRRQAGWTPAHHDRANQRIAGSGPGEQGEKTANTTREPRLQQHSSSQTALNQPVHVLLTALDRVCTRLGELCDQCTAWIHTQKRTAQSNRAQRSEDMQQRSPFLSCTHPGPARKTDLRNPDRLAVLTNYPRPFSDGH